MNLPQVSIIVPNYNHALYLKARLDSIFNQTYTNYEVILLDDASTDDSRQLLDQYQTHPNVSHVLYNEVNSGSPFKQWEKGIALAKGDYIWIAESDDFCDEHFLQEVSKFFNSKLGIIYTQSNDVDDEGTILGSRIEYTSNFPNNIWELDFELKGQEFIENYMNLKNVIPNASAVVFKKDLVDPTVFDDKTQNLKMLGDWLFWIKILSKTNICFISKLLNSFRAHDQTTRQHVTIDEKKKRLLEEWQIHKYLFDNHLKVSRDAINLMYERWFKIHGKSDILKNDFYKIRLNISKLKLFNKFIAYKLGTL